MSPNRSTLAGIALICFANLLLSILVTRLFSATMFYHFTFMAVGLAMFGVAASGVYVFLRSVHFSTREQRHLVRYSQYFAIATLVHAVYATRFPVFSGGEVPDWSVGVLANLLLLIVLTTLPFFFAGVVVSLALTVYRDHVSKVYFYDLVGAALAAVAAGIVLEMFGGPTAMLVTAAIGWLAAAVMQGGALRRFVWPALATALVVLNMVAPFVKVGSVKWERNIQFEEWNAFSRITVDKGLTIKIDAAAATQIEDLRRAPARVPADEITAFALHTWGTPPDRALVIGPGGGRDVMFALSAGARHVTAVEINPLIANAVMRGRYAEASGQLYRHPRVDVVVDEGRSFIRRTADTYDMIQASLVDTWAATSAGAFALTENTLYTIEAFEDYYAHLTPRGVVTMTRFYGEADGIGASESQRLIILAAGALERGGIAPDSTRKHMFFVAKDTVGTLVVKKTPFTADEVRRLETAAATAGFAVLLSPSTNGSSLLERYVDQGAWSSLVLGARDNLEPPTDDRPFFFYFTKFGDLFSVSGKRMYDAGLWVLISLGAVLALGGGFVLLPLIVGFIARRRSVASDPPRAQLAVITYFGLVGFAFIAVEIALLQRFTLFLGHPTYSLIVILFVILLSTAIGARTGDRMKVHSLGRGILVVGLCLALLNVLYGLVLGDLLRSWVGFARLARIALTALLVAPCGMMMGIMIPSAVRILAAAKSGLVPWAWGANGAMSVIGTSFATLCAMYMGFTVTFLLGAAMYALAALTGFIVARLYRTGHRDLIAT